MITIQDSTVEIKRESELREKLVAYYQGYIGCFVYLKKNDGVVCKGVFSEILPDGKIKVDGDYKTSFIEPLDIREFSAREANRGGGK